MQAKLWARARAFELEPKPIAALGPVLLSIVGQLSGFNFFSKIFPIFFRNGPKKILLKRFHRKKSFCDPFFLKPRVKIMFETSSREMCFLGSTFKWALYSNVKEEFGSFWQQLGILESDLYRLRERERGIGRKKWTLTWQDSESHFWLKRFFFSFIFFQMDLFLWSGDSGLDKWATWMFQGCRI